MSEHADFINKIPDNKPVRIFLPVTDSEERLRLSCILRKEEAPHFSLIFLKGSLPVDRIDKGATIIITLDMAGQIFSLEAKILEISNKQTLKMVAQKTINHEQMREYFRVDCTLPLLVKSIVPVEFDIPEEKWKITGTTVDLSGAGFRASLTSAPPADTQVRVELALPTVIPSIVKLFASPVRISHLSEKLWDAAYRFDNINDEDRDTIIGCCLVEQRRLLRLKVHVKDN